MLRKLLLVTAFIIGTYGLLYAGWTEPEQVNDGDDELQSIRDTDTPWGIAVDESGNVHFVFETNDTETIPADTQHKLDIHYRVKNYTGDWQDEVSVTLSETEHYYLPSNPSLAAYGHPSIILNADNKGLISYTMDSTPSSPYYKYCEMRTCEFDPDDFRYYDFMSEKKDNPKKYAMGWPGAHARKTPVMALDDNGSIYGFWMYLDTVESVEYYHIYYNVATYDGEDDEWSWGTEDVVSSQQLDQTHNDSSICALADPAGNIHLITAMREDNEATSVEVYHMWLDGSTWYGPNQVSGDDPDGTNSVLPYMAFSGDAQSWTLYVVWHDDDGEDTDVYFRRKDGQNWDDKLQLSNSGNAKQPCIATLSNGDLCVIWQDIIIGTDRWLYYRYYDASNPSESRWSAILKLEDNDELEELFNATIVSDNSDNFHLASQGYEDQNENVYYSFLDGPIDLCTYVVGDVNGSDSYNGLDIQYGVNYFKGGSAPLCSGCSPCSEWYYCGDVNADCTYSALDITYGVSYFQGGPAPVPCEDCPPAE
ncbi:MAG: hypothetical protein JSW64_00315 [Candidatus Zixiibacteriota bacterium]|nr:MAG: hypothetical protein JSW64_00315 [candidate division Zixibacteria bacterium]